MSGAVMNPLPDVEVGSDEPLYNIGVVSRMTGISMATLRAWERRYDFPEAERTAGGHRLYSERDVLRLRWVKGRIDDGMQTAQAINALRHQESTGHLVLTTGTFGSEGEGQAGVLPKIEMLTVEGKPHLKAYQERLLEILFERELQEADQFLAEALAVASPEELTLGVIGPVMMRIGEMWEQGETDVASEHLATNYLRQRLLTWMLSGPPARNVPPIVLACAPDEWHEGSLLILGALLRRRRWPVAYLGQSLPLEDLARFVEDIEPNIVIVVAMTEQTASTLASWPKYLPEAAEGSRPIFGYGGRIFREQPEWRLRVKGMYLGNSFEEGLETIERLLQQAP